MDATKRAGVFRLADVAGLIPGPRGERAALALKRGTLDITLSIPIAPNQQTPHEQGELYVVVRGQGRLIHGDQSSAFAAGDVLFVAAGTEHHHADFSADLALWRIFYGMPGGEHPLRETGSGA